MALHRNVGSVPLEGFAEGRQLFVGDEVDLSKADLDPEKNPLVAQHIAQGTLSPVTMAKTAAPTGQ